jgi:hypothetical protein
LLDPDGGFFAHGDSDVHLGFGGDLATVGGGAGYADAVDAFGEIDGESVGGDGAAGVVVLWLVIDGPAFDFGDGDGFAI